jgi:formate dehydrogenase major subunit
MSNSHPGRAAEWSSRIRRWPVLKQLAGDPFGLARAARSEATHRLVPRTRTAERVVQSVCPYCAVGCGQLVYAEGDEVTQIEGDPASPISRGRLCPKGAASKGLVTGPLREYRVKYRRPYGTEWEELSLGDAMEMIAERVISTRDATWEAEADTDEGRVTVNRTRGIGSLGGATLDNEENYLIKKLFTALGVVSVENQARI